MRYTTTDGPKKPLNAIQEGSLGDKMGIADEKLWYDLEYDKLSKEDAEDQLYVLKEEECKIEKKYRKLYCPEIKRFTEDTQKKTYHFLSLNFS